MSSKTLISLNNRIPFDIDTRIDMRTNLLMMGMCMCLMGMQNMPCCAMYKYKYPYIT